MNITATLNAKSDACARNVGPFIIGDEGALYVGSPSDVWSFVKGLGGRQFRVIYRCKDGRIRDMIGRQGVYNSAQDGMVQGVGHAMESEQNLTLSFWTNVYGGRAVNTGAGKGYRTLRADGILAIRCNGVTVLTGEGLRSLESRG